jgi:uncharacterized protein YciI
MQITDQRRYFVVTCVLSYRSFEAAAAAAPDDIAAHVKRSKELHEVGKLLMAGAFLDATDEPLTTMAIVPSREAAHEYLEGDPFYINGMIAEWRIREWANMLAS